MLQVKLTKDSFTVNEADGCVDLCVQMSGCQSSNPFNLVVKTKASDSEFLLQEESGTYTIIYPHVEISPSL